MIIIFGIIVCFLHTLILSDAAFTWRHSDASVDFIQGQTAKLVWTVDTGTKWVRIDISRSKVKSNDASKKVIDIVEQTGTKNKHLSGREADIDLVVHGTSNVVNVTFTLHNLVKTIDEMYYSVKLTASVSFQSETRYTFLRVLVLPGTPVLELHPNNPVFCHGDTINITCNGVTGNPHSTNLIFLQNDSTIGMLNGTTSGNYTKAVLSHALTQPGTLTFSCKATNAGGSSPTSNVVTIIVKDPPVITSCNNKTAVEKGNLVWTCDVSGSLPLTISWFKGNKNTVFQSGKSLNITTVSRADSGMYRFTASNGGECPTVSTTVYLDVQSKPRNVQVFPANIAALEINGSFNLTCIASSNPDSSYTWSLNGVTLDGKTNRVLTKDNITPQDAGEYTCTVTNSAGSGTSNKVTINVNYAPKMKACDSVRHLSENTSFVINCEKPNGFPTPSYITLFNGTSYNASITIDRVTKALNGSVIQCFASNALGFASCNTTLIVEFSEYVYKGSFRITNHLYQDILDDRSSLEFKILKTYIENMLKSVYTPYKYVTSAEVIEFWPGSVVVVFQLKLIANINDPLSPIKEALIKNGSSLDGLKIDPNSIQSGEYVPPTTMKTTKATTLQPKSSQIPAIVLGVLFAIALVSNIILVSYIFWKHRIENKARPKRSSNNNGEAIYMNNIALQDEVPMNVPQYESLGNQEQHQPTTQLYQSLQIQTQTDTYSSLSPNTKLPPKPAVITNSGVYEDLQGASRPQYQSLDNFSRV